MTTQNIFLGDNSGYTNACPKPTIPWGQAPDKTKGSVNAFPQGCTNTHQKNQPRSRQKLSILLTECSCKVSFGGHSKMLFSPAQEGSFYSCSDILLIEIRGCFIFKKISYVNYSITSLAFYEILLTETTFRKHPSEVIFFILRKRKCQQTPSSSVHRFTQRKEDAFQSTEEFQGLG